MVSDRFNIGEAEPSLGLTEKIHGMQLGGVTETARMTLIGKDCAAPKQLISFLGIKFGSSNQPHSLFLR